MKDKRSKLTKQFAQIFKTRTDPIEIKKRKLQEQRENIAKEKRSDYCYEQSK